jgi:arylsulfatase A-like enzyme
VVLGGAVIIAVMSERKPNIVMMHCHDLGQHIGPYGVKTVRTPNLDRLADESVVVEKMFCTAPQCSPSRASLFTGRYPHQTGVIGLCNPGPGGCKLNDDELHLAARLREAGYATALFGIMHETLRTDQDRLGYDVSRPAVMRSDSIASEAAAYLESRRDASEPFFLSVGFFEPHREFDFEGIAPDDSLGVTVPDYIRRDIGPALSAEARAELAALQGCIHQADVGVGMVLDALGRTQLAADTVVIFTADHGLAMPMSKCTLYDPGLEVPLIVRAPQWGLEAGARVEGMVSNVDVVPTILEALGIDAPDGRIAGRSMLRCLRGQEPGRRRIYAEKTVHSRYDPMRAVRSGDWKLIVNFEHAFQEVPGDVMAGHIYRQNVGTYQRRHPLVELYDLRHDPWERTNLAGSEGFADLRAELLSDLLSWMRDTGDPLLAGPIHTPHYTAARAALEG